MAEYWRSSPSTRSVKRRKWELSGRASVDLAQNLDMVFRMRNSEQASLPAAHDAPLDLLDAGQEQQGVVGDLLKAVPHLLEGLRPRLLRGIEREFEPRAAAEARVRGKLRGKHHSCNAEAKGRRPDARRLGVGEDGLEPDAEAADALLVVRLGSLPDIGDGPDVGFVECPPVVFECERVGREFEGCLGRSGVLGVLEQLVYEMRGVGIEILDDPADAGVFRQDAGQVLAVAPHPFDNAHAASLRVTVSTPWTTRVAWMSALSASLFRSPIRRSQSRSARANSPSFMRRIFSSVAPSI